jgi:hypothetical protein
MKVKDVAEEVKSELSLTQFVNDFGEGLLDRVADADKLLCLHLYPFQLDRKPQALLKWLVVGLRVYFLVFVKI